MDLSDIVHGLKPQRQRRATSSSNTNSPPSSSPSPPRQARASSSSQSPPIDVRLPSFAPHNSHLRRSASAAHRSVSDHSAVDPTPHATAAAASSSQSVLSCDKCSRTFSSARQFEQHISVFHARAKVPSRPRDANFLCAYCGKKFTSPSKRTLHVNATHMGLKPYQCETCSKSFGYKGDLAKHMASHSGEKPYSCYLCGARFARNFYVKRHIETIHEKKGQSSSL